MDTYGDDTQQPAAGWYSDPLQRGYERYWDGSQWSDERRPAAPAPIPERAPRPEPEPVAVAPQPARAPAPSGSPAQPAWPTAVAQPDEPQDVTLASPLQRLLGVTIDAVICNILGFVASIPVWISLMRRMEPLMGDPNHPTMPDQSAVQGLITSQDTFWIATAWLLVSVAYHTVLVGWRGATVGKLVAGIRVVPSAEPTRADGPGWGTALVRALAWSLLAQWPWIPYLLVLFLFSEMRVQFGRRRQTWPDLLARTLVVQRPRAKVTSHFNPR